jgi:hypothetical protein
VVGEEFAGVDDGLGVSTAVVDQATCCEEGDDHCREVGSIVVFIASRILPGQSARIRSRLTQRFEDKGQYGDLVYFGHSGDKVAPRCSLLACRVDV